MIPRYTRPEMAAIWEPENKFRIWFEIEAHACDAQAELGVIPKSAAAAVWERGLIAAGARARSTVTSTTTAAGNTTSYNVHCSRPML